MDKLLTVKELQAWLKCGRRTVNRLKDRGMPYVKSGNILRFPKAQVLTWLEGQAAPPGPVWQRAA